MDELHSAILRDPDDDRLRLVYADWLEEHGRGAEARHQRQIIMERQLDMEVASRRKLADWTDDNRTYVRLQARGTWMCSHRKPGCRGNQKRRYKQHRRK